MGEAFIISRGGSLSSDISIGDNISLTVIGSTTQPSNPVENMVWVNTSTAISSYDFSLTEPTTPSEGMVWFKIDDSSSVPMDIGEDNIMMVYPTYCKQYVNGAWVVKEFNVYLNGVWERGFWLYAYNKGDLCTKLTGGWDRRAIGQGGYFNKAVAPKITYNATTMNIYQTPDTQYANGIASTKNKIDLTPYSKVSIVVTSVSLDHGGSNVDFRIHDSFGSSQSSGLVASTSCKTTGTKTIDVTDINRAVYLGINAYWGVSMTFSEIRLEV